VGVVGDDGGKVAAGTPVVAAEGESNRQARDGCSLVFP